MNFTNHDRKRERTAMLSLVIVSHSPKIAQGTKDLAEQATQRRVPIFAAGGLDDALIGTNVQRIYEALVTALAADDAMHVLVLCDLGSSVMSTQMAIEMLEPPLRRRVKLSNAPLVEGAIIAAIEASLGQPLDEVNASAEAAAHLPKLT